MWSTNVMIEELASRRLDVGHYSKGKRWKFKTDAQCASQKSNGKFTA